MGCLIMKLRKILNEIGNTTIPPNTKFSTNNIKFKFENINYQIDFRIGVEDAERFSVFIDFYANGDTSLTNQNQPLKVMSYIFGCIEEWLRRKKKKCIYIGYNPKSESDETPNILSVNKRDRVYRMYLSKIADKFGSEVEFLIHGNVIARFNPPLIVK